MMFLIAKLERISHINFIKNTAKTAFNSVFYFNTRN